jgi:filamentous hemagglutinin family protein
MAGARPRLSVATAGGGVLSRRGVLLNCASPMVLSLVALMAGPSVAHAQAVNLGGAGANRIIPDGRTATRLSVRGTRTAITTGTVSKGTGFNSFSDFEEAAGQQVDLYVPTGAGNLVNIVRNGPVVVNGVLNAYKDGRIGGNVFFSDSHGFVVGKSGTINVGALTVNTPTPRFLDGVVGAGGNVTVPSGHQKIRRE